LPKNCNSLLHCYAFDGIKKGLRPPLLAAVTPCLGFGMGNAWILKRSPRPVVLLDVSEGSLAGLPKLTEYPASVASATILPEKRSLACPSLRPMPSKAYVIAIPGFSIRRKRGKRNSPRPSSGSCRQVCNFTMWTHAIVSACQIREREALSCAEDLRIAKCKHLKSIGLLKPSRRGALQSGASRPSLFRVAQRFSRSVGPLHSC
jgi:hypothetical protein